MSEYATRAELHEVKRELAQADTELRQQIVETERTLRAEQKADLSELREGMKEDINEVTLHLTAQDGVLDAVQQSLLRWTHAVVSSFKWVSAIAATVAAFVILHFIFGI